MNFSHITLVVTEECNLCCEYCFESKSRSRIAMDDHTFYRAIEILVKQEGKKSISFFGGEPLLSWNKIEKWADWISQNYPDISMSLTTNGTLLNPVIFQTLVSKNVYVLMSIDGFGENANLHRINKAKENIWQRWIKIVSAIPDKRKLKIRMTITPHNVSFLAYSIEKFVEAGIISISFALDYSSIWEEKDIDIYKQEYLKVLAFFKQKYLCGKRVHIDIIDRLLESGINQVYTRCRLVLDSLTVLPDGNIKICHRADERVISIFMPENEIFNKLDKYLISDYGMKECRECALYKRCVFCSYLLERATDRQRELLCDINKYHVIQTDKLISELYMRKNKRFMREYYKDV